MRERIIEIMTRDIFIKDLTKGNINMNPAGIVSDEISVEEFAELYPLFFDMVFGISKTDITGISGYGEFNEENRAVYSTCEEFIIDTFRADREDYWRNWHEMFETTMLSKAYFEKMLAKSLNYTKYCENRRFLVNNNTFFVNMISDKKMFVSCADWSRAGIMDFLIDFTIMDLNKPYLKIPERLFEYTERKGIDIPDFRERYLCMAFYKGIDTLRWHASIDDEESCESIMRYLDELEERIMRIGN